MNDRTQTLEDVKTLSDEQLQRVRALIETLRGENVVAPPGSLAAIKRAIGSWWMTPKETEQFLKDVDAMRHTSNETDGALPPEY